MSIIAFSDRLSKFLMVGAATGAFGLAFLVMGEHRRAVRFRLADRRHRRNSRRFHRYYRFSAGRLRHPVALHADGGFPGRPSAGNGTADITGDWLFARRRLLPDDHHRRLGGKYPFVR